MDITTAGDYSIVIGPLATADASPRFVNGISLPIDITFASRPDHQMSTFTGSDGKTYGKFTLHVSNVSATYSGLTVWTQ